MKREMLHASDSREDRKVLAAIDFAIFSAYCPATVSESETVFLCAGGMGGTYLAFQL